MTLAKNWPVSSATMSSGGFRGSIVTIHTEFNCWSQSQSTFSCVAIESRASAHRSPHRSAGDSLTVQTSPDSGMWSWTGAKGTSVSTADPRSCPCATNSHEMTVQRIVSTAGQIFDFHS